jgi:hypothetical protein
MLGWASPKKSLERAFRAFGGHFLAQSADRFVQCVYFIHFIDSPCTFLPMPSKHRVSVAIDTQSNASVLKPLFEVMRF